MFIRPTWRDYVFNTFNIFILLAFAFICVYPLWFIMINSFSSANAIAKGVYIIPMEPTLATYQQLARIPAILNSAFISGARTVLGTALCLAFSSLLGYLVSNKDLPYRKFIYRYFIFTMYFSAGFIPWYMLMKNLGLKNNFLLYILPGAISPFFLILIKTYIESLPASMEEAAKIDGAGVITCFYKIIMPLSIPILACCAVFCAVWQWNSWADNLYLVSDKRLQTLQYLLYLNLQANMASAMNASSGGSAAVAAGMAAKVTPLSLKLTFTFVTVLPILCVYPFMQKYFVKGIMMGAVKG